MKRIADDFIEFQGRFKKISYGIIFFEIFVMALDVAMFLVLDYLVFKNHYWNFGKNVIVGNMPDHFLFPEIGYCPVAAAKGIRSVQCTLPLNHNYWNAFMVTWVWQIVILAIGMFGILAKLPTLFSFKARKMTFGSYVSL